MWIRRCDRCVDAKMGSRELLDSVDIKVCDRCVTTKVKRDVDTS